MIRSFLFRRPLTCFFLLTFAFTWGLCAYLIATAKPDSLQNISAGFIAVAVLSGLSPSFAALVLTIARGEAKGLFAQLTSGVFRRFAIPVMTLVPVATLVSYLISSRFEMRVERSTIMLGLIWPLFSSFGEEFGWRGFAVPKLLDRKGFLYSALLIGIIWGMWHLPMDYIGLRAHGWLFIPEFILVGPGILTAHSVIMTYIYVRSKRNLSLMILYHYTITEGAIIIPGIFAPQASGGLNALLQPLYANVILWIPAACILLRSRKLTSAYRKEGDGLTTQTLNV